MSATPAAGLDASGPRPLVPRAVAVPRAGTDTVEVSVQLPRVMTTLADPTLAATPPTRAVESARPMETARATIVPRRTQPESILVPEPEQSVAAPDPTVLLGEQLLHSPDEIASMLRQLLTQHEPAAVAVPVEPLPTTQPEPAPAPPPLVPNHSAPRPANAWEWSIQQEDHAAQSIVPAWSAAVREQTLGLTFPFVTATRCGRISPYATTLVQLCRRLAEETGQNVLLLDAALPHHELTTACGLVDEPGLYEVLTRRLPLSACVHPLFGATVGFVPAGQSEPIDTSAPLDLATGLAELSGRFGWVVCDTGSLVHPWSLALARSADAAYLALELGTTPQQLAIDCVNRFRQQGGIFRHCILLPPEPHELA